MRKFTLLASLLMFVMLGFATGVIPVEDAMKASKNFLVERVGFTKASQMDIVLVNTEYSEEGIPVTYRFQVGDKGFMIVSATELANPVLAYSLESNFEKGTGADLYNEQYKRDLSSLVRNPEGALTIRNSWDRYLAADFQPMVSRSNPCVEPLVTTRWTQEKYYNTMCPYNPRNSYNDDFHTPVGCVALTMANILFYYRFPESGYGMASYIPHEYDNNNQVTYTYPMQTVNYSQATYNYDAMANRLESYDGELAKLIYHCGVATRMSYGFDGSGSQSERALNALITHYFFNEYAQFQNLSDVATHDSLLYKWVDKAKKELDNRRPLFFSGASATAGGHAWIVDGYTTIGNATYFHVNWGWNGQNNGYFLINNQNTSSSGNFNMVYQDGTSSNSMMVSLMPDSLSIVKPAESFRRVTASFGTISDGAGNMKYAKGSNRQWVLACPNATSYTLSFDKLKVKEGDKVIIYNGGTTASGIKQQYSGNYLMAACNDYWPISGSVEADYEGQQLPAAITVNADSVLVVFTSTEDSETDFGFVLSYKVNSFSKSGCTTRDYTDQTAVLTDKPNNEISDEDYIPSNVCEYNLNLRYTNRFAYIFNKFDLKGGDFVDIYYYANMQDRQLLAHYDANNVPAAGVYYTLDIPTVSQGGIPTGRIKVRFASDNEYQGSGFEFEYWGGNTGINNTEKFSASVYPNPAVSDITVEISADEEQTISAEIVDLTGRTVYTDQIHHAGGTQKHTISVNDFAKGVYFLNMNTSNGKNVQKFIVQ